MHITQLINAASAGDAAAAEQILPLVYEELRQLAARRMNQEIVEHTLQPTALVHEAYLRLVGESPEKQWDNRGHFYAAAAEAMRRILIEAARSRAAIKRGGGRVRVLLEDNLIGGMSAESDATLLSLDVALDRLGVEDGQSAELVKLRYFGGLTIDEAAAALKISPRTAKRNWAFARAWLQREVERDP